MIKGSVTFWIIDDDPVVFKLLSHMFPEYSFISLNNRKMVLKEAHAEQQCAGIILDYKLKYNMTGFDLLPLFKKLCPDVPILLLTAYDSKEIALEAKRTKIDFYHNKPIQFKELGRSLKAFAEKATKDNIENKDYNRHVKNIDSLLTKPTQNRTLLKVISYNNSLSYKYISRKYKKETGHSFSEHQIICIVETAKELLLTTQLSVKEISMKLGYQYPSSFMRLFKNQTGMTASEFKKKNKK